MPTASELLLQQLQKQQEARHQAILAEAAMFSPYPSLSALGAGSAFLRAGLGLRPGHPVHVNTHIVSPKESFQTLKKSVKSIEAEPFNGEEKRRIEDKINRLQSAGAVAQACILSQEIRTRQSLVHLKEWDYKLLTKETIDKFQTDNQMTMTRDGLKVHIVPLDKYCGNPQVGEAKDRIMPDHILESLETAKSRELFDDFAVLYVEKVKDPLLLGIVEGCEDYFFIAEWGEDISFEQITKGE